MDPKKSKEKIFNNYKDEIKELQENLNLDDFGFYTAYYYQVASDLNYEIKKENKELKDFFEIYANTYDLENYYLENSIYFKWFYRYTIN